MAANVAIGRMPFALGLAIGVAAWACAGRGRAWRPPAAVLALAAVWASPVAGAFLILAAAARVAGRRAGQTLAAWVGLPAVAGGALLVALFPGGGPDGFVATAFWPMLLISAAGAVPTTFGQNALRLAVLLGPPLLVLAARERAPRAAIAAVVAALVYPQWLPAVRAVREAAGDPSTRASFFAEARAFLGPRVQPGERVEVAFTRNHWEVSRLATAVPLARGWERQLDQKVNAIFYDDERFTTERYQAWLTGSGVRWVALPAAPLDYSARAEADLLERGPAFLRLAYATARWRIWEVRDPGPPASGGARVLAAGPEGFEVAARGRTVVRQRYTPYWRAEGGCVRRGPGGWTEVVPHGRARVRVRAAFALPLTGHRRGCDPHVAAAAAG